MATVSPSTAPGTTSHFHHRWLNPWLWGALVIAAIVAVPVAVVLVSLTSPAGDNWQNIRSTVLSTYILNTLTLTLGATALATLFGLPTAWFIATSNFPGRRLFSWALVLPLAVPTYIAAYAYSPALDYSFEILIFARDSLGANSPATYETVYVKTLLVVVLASVLFPYVYLACRASFARGAGTAALEAARTLGATPWTAFHRVSLPMVRPALAGGLTLVAMEVINDYGAVSFFNVPTLTDGIFRAWRGSGDLNVALRIAACVMLFVLALIVIERLQRGRARFADTTTARSNLHRRKLSPLTATLAVTACLVPLATGFLYPVYQMLRWSTFAFAKTAWPDFTTTLLQTLALASSTSLILVAAAVLVAYANRLHPGRTLNTASKIATLGYAIPGAVVAIGALYFSGALDTALGHPFLSNTFALIILAYLARFLAVSLHPVEAGLTKTCATLDSAARTLGESPLRTLFRVDLPLLKPALAAAAILVFVDVLKELPLTVVLRPANFNTLATRAFDFAYMERIPETSIPSLAIIITGACATLLLDRLVNSRHR